MSQYESISVPKYKFKRVNEVAFALGIRPIQASNVHHTKKERESTFIKSIAQNAKLFISQINTSCNKLSDSTINKSMRLFALKKSLMSDDNTIVKEVVIKENILDNTPEQLINKINILNSSSPITDIQYFDKVLSDELEKTTKAIHDANIKISFVENEILKKETIISLKGLGYKVKEYTIGNEILIRGIKNDLSIVAQIDKYNEMQVDMGGFEGNSCVTELKKFHVALKDRGIEIDVNHSEVHDKKAGPLTLHIEKKFNEIENRHKTKFKKKSKNNYNKAIKFKALSNKLKIK